MRKVEGLGPVAQDHVVRLLPRLVKGRQRGVPLGRCPQRIELAEPLAPLFLLLVADARRDDAFHLELRLRWITAGGEGLVAGPQEADFREPPQRVGEHDVGRNQPLVSGIVALQPRNHGADGRINPPAARLAPGQHQVGRRLVAIPLLMELHAPYERVLVRHLGQLGQ